MALSKFEKVENIDHEFSRIILYGADFFISFHQPLVPFTVPYFLSNA